MTYAAEFGSFLCGAVLFESLRKGNQDDRNKSKHIAVSNDL